MLNIRTETPADYRAVEELTRRAFYNIYTPGCTEHYLVHTMRSHPDFIPELALVAEEDGGIVGNVMYTKSRLTDDRGEEKTILTFGPISVEPGRQRQGIGKAMLEESFRRAIDLGYDAIVIFGSPVNYVARGFQSCKKFHVSLEGGKFPAAMMVKELVPGALGGKAWVYRESPAMEFSEEEARRYDDALPPMEKKWLPSQEEFYIMSRSSVK